MRERTGVRSDWKWLSIVAASTLACASDPKPDSDPPALGASCVPSHENATDFSGFSVYEVSVHENGCTADQVCLVNHFQGRVTCPNGQTNALATIDPPCKTSSDGEPVTAPVMPWLVARQAPDTVYCSCRCDGGGGCVCPRGYSCLALELNPTLSSADSSGSYCVLDGTAFDIDDFDPRTLPPADVPGGSSEPPDCGGSACSVGETCIDDECCSEQRQCADRCCAEGQLCAALAGSGESQCWDPCDASAACPDSAPCCAVISQNGASDLPVGVCSAPSGYACACMADDECVRVNTETTCRPFLSQPGVSTCQRSLDVNSDGGAP
jgi:hypothetical protein